MEFNNHKGNDNIYLFHLWLKNAVISSFAALFCFKMNQIVGFGGQLIVSIFSDHKLNVLMACGYINLPICQSKVKF